MDAVIARIGELGVYQKRKFLLLTMQFCASPVLLFSVVYTLGEPPHRCKVESNDTFQIRDELHNITVRQRVPVDENGLFKPCSIYTESELGSEKACDDLVYDTTEVGRTLASEYSLVCEKRQLAAAITTTGFVGRLVGSLAVGVLADRYGRKRTYVVFIIALAVSSAASIAPNPYSYAAFRVLASLCNSGAFDCAYVIIMEIVGTTKRTLINTLTALIYTFGYLLVNAAAYLLRDWQHLSIFVAAPFVLQIFIVILFIPESPRWLLSQGRVTEAKNILAEAARVNGVTFPQHEFTEVSQQRERDKSGSNIKELFANRAMLKRVMLFNLLWFAVDMGYFGVALQSGYIFGGLYLNNTLSALSELPSFLMTYASFYIGRKRATILSILMATSGLLCAGLLQFISHSPDTGYGILACTMFGKVGATAAYNLLYVWTVETVPTGHRNLVLGICSAASGLSATIVPFIVQINTDKGSASQAIPSVVFGILLALSTLATLPLPETSKESLPDSINDAVKLGEKKEASATVANRYLELMAKEEAAT